MAQEEANKMMTTIRLLMLLVEIAFADLISHPKDTEALVGAATFFNCSTTLRTGEIQWFLYNVGSDQERRLVHGFDQCHGTFQGRCRLEANEANGEYNLVIESVSIEDAGKFECQDDIGRGAKGSAQLTVLQAAPLCVSNMRGQEIIGPNSGGIEPEDLHLNCTADYRGNQPPQMVWKRPGSDDAITEGVTHKIINDTRVTYSLTLKAYHDVDGQTFVCETTKSITAQYGCNSGPVRVVGVVQSNTAVTVLSIFLCVSLIACIVISTIWLKSRKRPKREKSIEIPAAIASEPSEQSQKLLQNNKVQQEKLELLEKENIRLSSKVSEYEDRLYKSTGGIQYKEKPDLIQTTSVQKGEGAINGITVLNGELFAIFKNSPDIVVYDSITFGQNSNPLHVDGLSNPRDIASCSTNNCLYVIDELNDAPESHLLKIDPNGIQPMQRWKHVDCHEGRLSVYETNVIVCLTHKRLIVRYSANGESLQTIRLSPSNGFDQLWCAIQVTEANFVVSNYNKSNEKHNLCLVDCDGKIIAPVNDEQKLKTAICLVNDSDKSVLVLLQNGDTTFSLIQRKALVVLLDPTLKNKRTLIEYSLNDYGVKMCLDCSGSRLFVAVNSAKPDGDKHTVHSGRILFYNIKRENIPKK